MKYRTTTKNTIDNPNIFCMKIILFTADCLLFCEYSTTLIEERWVIKPLFHLITLQQYKHIKRINMNLTQAQENYFFSPNFRIA